MRPWTYWHEDLDEPPLPDGSQVVRPVVPLVVPSISDRLIGVLDSGSPISVASAGLFRSLGIDIERTPPLYEVSLHLGATSAPTRVFDVELTLKPPHPQFSPISFRLHLGARPGWRLPFAVLFGQRGWFDRFPTRIDARTSTVEV